MQIGTVKIDGRLVLAPMAGVTDLAFRRICREHGAALTVTEMVSTKALCYQDKKTPRLLELAPDEHPAAAQIFGHDPETMAEGAKIALEKSGCDIIDINMGCPAPKIAGNGDGSALMRDLPLASRVIEAVVQAVDVPVTVKFRKGWDEKSVNCVEFARMAEQSGAAAIAVHGRTRSQQYSGTADWDAIRDVKQAVGIPVIANGDVAEPEDAVRILAHTGADGVMFGMSEHSDAVIVIVSEETGGISIAVDGMLKRRLSPDTFEAILRSELVPAEEQQRRRWDIIVDFVKKLNPLRREKQHDKKDDDQQNSQQ